MWNRRHRWIRRFAAGLAFAALAVPTAQAGANDYVLKDGMWVKAADPSIAGVSDSGYVLKDGMWRQVADTLVADFKGYGYYEGTPTAASDGQVYRQSPGVPVSEQNPSVAADDRADRVSPEPGNPQVVAAPAVGFEWSDAGIGAGTAVGVLLLALGAALATRRVARTSLAGA